MTAGRALRRALVRGSARLRHRGRRRCWCAIAVALRARLSRRSPAASSIRPTSSRPTTRNAIEPKLADLEAKSGIQLVVATVTSLEGQEIEPYANALFRTWKLGEKTKNNGVLLLVAPNEHRVRIEVGYGLEGTLTDALSKVIITNAIAPRFKTGDFGDGISRGVDDIITVLTTDASEWQQRPSLRLDNQPTSDPVELDPHRLADRPGHAARSFRRVPLVLPQRGAQHPAQFRRLGGGGGFAAVVGGGGFSGGGGSSGGGGASGSW